MADSDNNNNNNNLDYDNGNSIRIEGYTKEKLYGLIPAIYRQHDSKQGKPLKDLIDIIAKQVAALENDIGSLYDNWFIETCDEWVTSYIADLVGAKSLSASKVLSSSTTEKVSQRGYVANTIRYRRRKGTISMLEELAADITQWGSKAVEFFKLLEMTQNINHLRLFNYRTPNLRDMPTLDLLDTPFDIIAHTLEVRRIRSNRGLYNIPNIGIFLWRLDAFPSYNTSACKHLDQGQTPNDATREFRFNVLGYDEPIFNSPYHGTLEFGVTKETDLPLPIRRRALNDKRDDYYGKDLAIFIKVKYVDESEYREINARDIQVCNLEKEWDKPCTDKVAIDPKNGRISLTKEATDVRVTYYYGFSSKVGGGFYKRSGMSSSNKSTSGKTRVVFTVSKYNEKKPNYKTIQAAIGGWIEQGYGDITFEILDSEIYHEALKLAIPVNCNVSIMAANEQRPIIDSIEVKGERGSSLLLDGLWFNNPETGPHVKINPGDLGHITIRHCTLVPGQNTTIAGKVGIDLKSYIRRRICTWEEIISTTCPHNYLKEFMTNNFANWKNREVTKFEISKDKIEVTLSYGANLLRIRLDPDGTTAHVTRKEGQHAIEQNVYEFMILKEDETRNLYVKGGNDDLQIILDRSITGSVQMLDSSIFAWDKISADNEGNESNKRLREFLRANFDLSWLTDEIPFVIDDSAKTIKAQSTVATTASSEDGGDGDKYSLTITLNKKENLAVLEIITKGTDEKYTFVVKDKNVYYQSEAHLSAVDSIIDGKGDGGAIVAHSMKLENTTVFGKTIVNKLMLASNVIFTDIVTSTITQKGCVRFSYVPPRSKTPKQYMCQPAEGKDNLTQSFSSSATGAIITEALIVPNFTSDKYGDPGYAQLHRNIAPEIFQGADNGAEMGVFNHLFQPQRISDLKASLDEYLRFGLEAGVFLVT